MLNRRALLVSASALALYGCATPAPVPPGPPNPPGPIISQTVLDDINLILAKLQEIMPALQSLIPEAIYAKAMTYLNEAQKLVNTLGAGGDGATVQQIISLVEQVLATLQSSGVSLPSWVTVAITAAEILIPVILAAVGVTTARRSVASPAEIARARAVLRTPSVPPARLRLRR